MWCGLNFVVMSSRAWEVSRLVQFFVKFRGCRGALDQLDLKQEYLQDEEKMAHPEGIERLL